MVTTILRITSWGTTNCSTGALPTTPLSAFNTDSSLWSNGGRGSGAGAAATGYCTSGSAGGGAGTTLAAGGAAGPGAPWGVYTTPPIDSGPTPRPPAPAL